MNKINTLMNDIPCRHKKKIPLTRKTKHKHNFMSKDGSEFVLLSWNDKREETHKMARDKSKNPSKKLLAKLVQTQQKFV